MTRLVLTLGTLALLSPLVGCGSGGPPGSDGSGVPSEVQEYEKRREMERTKGVKPQATPPAGVGSAPR